ncbi:hypothetical protein K456DRAFT_314177 [Colletotrichum gloeosporioides 23]|nr:hypothetical protein K456DRAFT_314177 [Colletotrichum gloeosporioides 23]
MRERPGQLWHCAFLFGFFAFIASGADMTAGARRWGLLNAICALGDISGRPKSGAYSGRWTVNVGDGGIVSGVFLVEVARQSGHTTYNYHTLTQSET